MNERLQKAVSYTIQAGYQLDSDAFSLLEMLAKTEDPVALMEELVQRMEESDEKPLFITRNFLEDVASGSAQRFEETRPKGPSSSLVSLPEKVFESRKVRFKPLAKEVEADIRVIEDPTDHMCTVGSVDGYIQYFRDRFKRLQRLLRQRIDTKDATTISNALRAPMNSKVKIIGMVTDRRESKKGFFLRLEDLESCATVLASSKLDKTILQKVRSLLLDQVVCISARKAQNDLLILEDIFLPDVPQRKPRRSDIPVCAALISDLHVGSKEFMREEFNRFLRWLNGKLGNAHLREVAGRIKYVAIAGDLVDGIGVYPGQLDELAIADVHEQYKTVSTFLEQIPDYLELIVIPGNHDACRAALPQPALPKKYAEPLHEARRLRSLGNPSLICLHGVELLLYHGRSLDDVVAAAPGLSYRAPEKAMKLLLQCRHLSPIYGQRTPIAPEKHDFMVIERVPDIFHAGHVHVMKHDKYRGKLIVNSGAWQEQTQYMRKLGFVPTPGIAPIVNLQTLQTNAISFTTGQMWM